MELRHSQSKHSFHHLLRNFAIDVPPSRNITSNATLKPEMIYIFSSLVILSLTIMSYLIVPEQMLLGGISARWVNIKQLFLGFQHLSETPLLLAFFSVQLRGDYT